MTIFIIEDEKALAETLYEFLHKRGYTVEVARNGAEATKMLPVVRPNLILLDLILPEMNGVDFLKEIQKPNSEFSKTPVIVLTNLYGDEKSFEKLGVKVSDYAVKSDISLEKLADKIKKALS